MKHFLVIVVVTFCNLFAMPAYGQWYNEVGYDATLGQWNVELQEIYYQWSTGDPNRINGFYFQIQNNTTYSITGIDLELELSDGNRTFWKNYIQLSFNGTTIVADGIGNTSVWELNPPVARKKFESKKFRWVYKVKNVYGPP